MRRNMKRNMRRIFRGYAQLRDILFLLISIFLTVNAYSQDMPSLAAPSSMTFDFVQRKSSDMLAEDIVNSGRMAFIAPDRIRWEYITPYSSLFVMNGGRVLMENADGRKVTDAKSAGAYSRIFRLVMPLVRGDFQKGESGDFRTTVTDGGDCLSLEIVPLKSGGRRLFRRVVADVDKELGVAVRIAIYEGNGDETVITCTDIVLNAPVDEKLFEFR